MESFLALGFLIGMSHALEADHLAAVGALSAQGGTRKRLALRGAAWGVGHTITLFLISAAVIVFGFVLTDERSAVLEFGVGVMLVLLGLGVLRRMVVRRIHFHAHRHGTGRPHIHVHSHAGSAHPHHADPHEHRHPERYFGRALAVGLVHGAAGSAGLLALALAATQSPAVALAYVVLFGLGSVAGMAALTFVASWPLGWAERGAGWLQRGLSLAAASAAIVIGVSVMMETFPIASAIF